MGTADGRVESRLRELGLELPEPPSPVANYVEAVQAGELIFVAGHGPRRNGELAFIGKLGRDLDVEQGKEAARIVALNILATLRQTTGDLDRIARVVKLLVLVNSDPEFTQQYLVADGASDLFVEVFGAERGSHARAAIGMASLPFGIAVEIESVFSL